MKSAGKKIISSIILFSFFMTMFLPVFGGTAEGASKAPKLNKSRLVLSEKQTQQLTIKNASKATSIQWKSKNNKYVTVKKYKKTKAKVTGVKKGKTVSVIATVKVKKRKYTLTCKVQVKGKPTPTKTPTKEPTPKTTEKPTSGPKIVFSANFDSGQKDGFDRRYVGDVSVVDGGYSGKALLASNRTAYWQGATVDISKYVEAGATYSVIAWVKQTSGQQRTISCKYQGSGQFSGTPIHDVTTESNQWTKVNGTFTVGLLKDILLYFEMPTLTANDTEFPDFYIDEVTVSLISKGQTAELASLKDAFADYFSIGTAITASRLQNSTTLNVVKSLYNSITLENETKPQSIMTATKGIPNLIDVKDAEVDVPASYKEAQMPQLNFASVDAALQIAKDNGIGVRGHCLVWHSQTPDWFFRENYSNEEGVALVSKEVMDARMENYIKQVLYHIQNKYPGVVYAWDVVNEIFQDGSGSLRGASESNWYAIYKNNTFAINAFEYARTYANENVKLFYNDFNEYMDSKRDAIYSFADTVYRAGYLDGIGMQSHINDSDTTVEKIRAAIDKFNSIDPGKIEIQLTELDVSQLGNTDEWHAKYYEDLFRMLLEEKTGGVSITNVTFWGMHDGVSWRSGETPLIFKEGMVPKDSYYRILAVAEEFKKGA